MKLFFELLLIGRFTLGFLSAKKVSVLLQVRFNEEVIGICDDGRVKHCSGKDA